MNTKPKWSAIFSALSPALFFSFFLFLAVHNFRKDPSDNISLASIIFFSLFIGFIIGTNTMKYVQRKSGGKLN